LDEAVVFLVHGWLGRGSPRQGRVYELYRQYVIAWGFALRPLGTMYCRYRHEFRLARNRWQATPHSPKILGTPAC
ncbi:MAG: hypothetical protein L3K26_07540, partial [Candidatus Hydrogenedentes bacterium]|nr:hypothetical protein [Candidatus Hydrogenedentota bacterium]